MNTSPQPAGASIAKPRHSVQKRRHEANKLEKKEMKEARRARRLAANEEARDALASGIDPDLAGIVAGPQPTPEAFRDEEDAEEG